ncbi:MAG: hypothetical protein ACLP8B_15015 [Xanthobacteraceae bacterium]
MAVISAYLFVCFAAEIQFKASVLHAHDAFLALLGVAAVKAVICAKFMLLGSAFHVGGRLTRPPLILPTLYRSFAFLVLLIVLNVIEEAVVGLIHGRTVRESLVEIAGGTWQQIIATSVILVLILIPYFAFRALGDIIGEKTLVQLYFAPRERGSTGRRAREADQ